MYPKQELREKPCRIAWMNMKWINIHIAEMHSHHICGTDVYVALCILYPFTHGGHRNARSLPTIQDKRELAGGREGWMAGSWSLDEEISLQLLHFVVPAQEAQWQLLRGDILWYIVREALGQNAKRSRWKSDILFKDHVGERQMPAPAFPKPDFKFTVYFPRWSYDLLKDAALKLLSICDVKFLRAKASTW